MTQTPAGAEGVADVIVRIPRRMRASGDVSVYDLATRSGYFEQHERVREPVISQRLRALPELVDEWLMYSEGKRVGRGWFFRVTERQYEVGYFGGSRGEQSSKVYDDRFDACATFIKQEMEEIRSQ